MSSASKGWISISNKLLKEKQQVSDLDAVESKGFKVKRRRQCE